MAHFLWGLCYRVGYRCLDYLFIVALPKKLKLLKLRKR